MQRSANENYKQTFVRSFSFKLKTCLCNNFSNDEAFFSVAFSVFEAFFGEITKLNLLPISSVGKFHLMKINRCAFGNGK